MTELVNQFYQGSCIRAYELLGCHKETRDGVEGYVFRVWAPNAHYVAVVGDFNFWNAGDLPMYRISQGVWEAFSVHAKPGGAYKIFIDKKEGAYFSHVTSTQSPNCSNLEN